jgi:fumarylacetoacetase
VLDLWESSHEEHHATGSLNAFLARGPEAWRYLRVRLQNELTDEAYRAALEPFLEAHMLYVHAWQATRPDARPQ